MDIQLINPTQLLPYERNPRNNEDTIETVAKSIQEFGFRQPIVVDEEMVILAGHTRHQASLELELEQVPVHIAKGLDEAQKRSFRIMDNKSAEMSTWDRDMLKAELSEIANFDFDMTLTGFTLDEIARLGGDHIMEFATEVDDDEPVEELLDDYTIANVRMVFLYLTTETEPIFKEMCDDLQRKLQTENITDTIYKLVEDAHSKI